MNEKKIREILLDSKAHFVCKSFCIKKDERRFMKFMKQETTIEEAV
jgi:hypothetical protein